MPALRGEIKGGDGLFFVGGWFLFRSGKCWLLNFLPSHAWGGEGAWREKCTLLAEEGEVSSRGRLWGGGRNRAAPPPPPWGCKRKGRKLTGRGKLQKRQRIQLDETPGPSNTVAGWAAASGKPHKQGRACLPQLLPASICYAIQGYTASEQGGSILLAIKSF